jgi:hypothetical protein
LTGSIFWDSELNRWIYVNASGSGGGATYGGGMFISGPRNSVGLGCEQGTTACMLLVGQGGDHLTSSMIYHSSTVTCIPGASITSAGAACFASSVTAKGTLTLGDAGVTNAIINSADGMYFNLDTDLSGGSPEFMFGKGRSGAGSGGTTLFTISCAGLATFGGQISMTNTNPGIFMNGSAVDQTSLISNANGPSTILKFRAGSFIWVNSDDVERMRIWTTTGNVNIGTTPASDSGYKLDVNGTGRFSRNDAANISLTISNAFINQGNLINFVHNTAGSTTNGYIGHGGDNTGNFVILNNGITALSLARATGAATFSSSVGIGNVAATSAGGTAFMVYDSATPRIRLTNSTTGTTSTDGSELSLYNSDFNIENREAGSMNFYVNGSKRFDIASTGAATFSSSVTAATYLTLSEDGTYTGTYYTLGFSGNSNGANRIFGARDGSDGIYIASATGTPIHFRAGGGTTNNLIIASTGAATFCSCVTATQFNVSTSGGATQIYNTGGGHTVITNATANKDINYQTSGTGGHYLNTAGVDRLIISSTGTAQFNSEDISGNRTTLNDVLTITQINGNAPYSGFGSGILFRGTTYNGGGSGISATRSWGRIGMQVTDSSLGTTGENMIFQVAAADNSDTLTTALTLAYNSAATFTSSVTAASLLSSTWVGAQGVRISSAPSVQGVYLGNSGTTCGDFATIEMVGGVCGGSEIDFTSPSLDYTGRIGYNNPSKYMWFVTNSNERMRIFSCGQVAINRTDSGGGALGVRSFGNTTAANAFYVDNSSCAELFSVRNDGFIRTGNLSVSPYNNATSGRTMVIESDGGGLGYTSSTRESKTNITTLSDVNWINQLNPVSFNYRKKDDERNYTEEFYEETSYGFIADEVEVVNPDFVFYNDKEDGTKELAGVKYESMTAILVKALQEQQRTINTLKTCLGIA